MSESTSGGSSGWAFPGAQALPGLSPRPQHHVVGKKGGKEMIDSTSKALFVFVKNCEDMEVEVNGKVGKVTIENGKSLRILVNDHVVSGTLELIRCQNVNLVYGKDAEVGIYSCITHSSTDIKCCVAMHYNDIPSNEIPEKGSEKRGVYFDFIVIMALACQTRSVALNFSEIVFKVCVRYIFASLFSMAKRECF